MNKNVLSDISSVEDLDRLRESFSAEVDRYFGTMPSRPEHLSIGFISDEIFAAGAASLEHLNMIMAFGEREYTIPFTAVIPQDGGRHPAIVHISECPDVPNKYQPTEELVDIGFAVFTFCPSDGAADALAREGDGAGLIARAAFIASRIIDYAYEVAAVDTSRIAVIGHAMLGAAALLAAARDGRITYAVSNGAGIYIGADPTICHTCSDILSSGAAYSSYSGEMLLSLIAPRHILIGCSEADLFASAESEEAVLNSVAPIYALYGENFKEKCHFHKRCGTHYLSRADYKKFTEHILNEEEKRN